MSQAAISTLPLQAASWSGVAPRLSRSFTPAPWAIWSLTCSRLPDRTASWRSAARSATATASSMATRWARPSTHVLYLFLQLDAEPREHASFELLNHAAEIRRGTGAGVVDQIGVVGGHVDIPAIESLGAHLLQKPTGRHLPLTHRRTWDLGGHGWRQVPQQQVLENAAGALHGDGELLIAHLQNVIGGQA